MGISSGHAAPFRFQIAQKATPRGPLHRYKLTQVKTFICCRCSGNKKSRNVAAVHDDWNLLLCNSCYGWLLSIWQIKSGDLPNHERDEQLLKHLAKLAGVAEMQRARAVLLARDARSSKLSPKALDMLATAEAVAEGFAVHTVTELDWSAAVVPLCKALEVEVRRLICEPLRHAVTGQELDPSDRKKFGKIASFCRAGRFPELGTVGTFLGTVTSAVGVENSRLVAAMRSLASDWPRSDWLFATDGFPAQVLALTRGYRNPAAHTELLSKEQYRSCAQVVQGEDGILWRLLAAVDPTRRQG